MPTRPLPIRVLKYLALAAILTAALVVLYRVDPSQSERYPEVSRFTH